MKRTTAHTYDPKSEARAQWTQTPCGFGPHLKDLAPGSQKFFEEVRRNRYQVTDTWIPRAVPFEKVKGKKLLEVGYGMGTDLITFCQAGALVSGIDLCQEHYDLAKENFRNHGMKADLKISDASDIPFPTGTFDIVYSLGVLHHTPDTVRCIGEIFRVLRPGGELILGLYNKFSAFHICSKLLVDGLFRRKLFSLGYSGLMATVERGADGIKFKPLVKTYDRNQLRHMLADFSSVRLCVFHFRREHIPYIGPLFIFSSAEKWLEPLVGWYLVAYAIK